MALNAAAMPRILAGGKMTKQPTSDRTIQLLLGALLVTQGGDTIMRRADPKGAEFQQEVLAEMHDISVAIRDTNARLAAVVEKLDAHDRNSKTKAR
jgi:hypothetical protein